MTWFDEAVATLADGSDVVCEAGHDRHLTQVIPVVIGSRASSLIAFKADAYEGTLGYCPGDDDVSRTLALYGHWETAGTEMFEQALAHTEGAVIDFGTHVGWYTMHALLEGREVLAVEAVSEHEELTALNAKRHGFTTRLHQAHCWVNNMTRELPWEGAPQIAIAKIDIEGNEQWAIASLGHLISRGLVRNIMLEVSPCFNDSYPAIVDHLMNMGYRAAVIDPWFPFGISDIDAVIADSPQSDMIFSLEPWWS